jgi:hypothetical protein
MLTLFKILTTIWPFIREMFFGNKTMAEIIKDNKFRVLMLALITASMTLNYFLTSRTVAISRDYLVLKAEYEALKSSKKTPVTQSQEVKHQIPLPAPVAVAQSQPVNIPPPRPASHAIPHAPPKRRDDSAARYQKLQKTLADIKAREENEE